MDTENLVMKKFQATSDKIQVNGETILAFVNGVKGMEESRLKILMKYGIIDPQAGKWYSQQAWLKAFEEVATSLGEVNLRLIGKAIVLNSKFPPRSGTQEAFEMIDKAYKMNHGYNNGIIRAKDSDIGWYKLILFDEQKKNITMDCNTPYPEAFVEGFLTGLFDAFKPNGAFGVRIKRERSKHGMLYILTW